MVSLTKTDVQRINGEKKLYEEDRIHLGELGVNASAAAATAQFVRETVTRPYIFRSCRRNPPDRCTMRHRRGRRSGRGVAGRGSNLSGDRRNEPA